MYVENSIPKKTLIVFLRTLISCFRRTRGIVKENAMLCHESPYALGPHQFCRLGSPYLPITSIVLVPLEYTEGRIM